MACPATHPTKSRLAQWREELSDTIEPQTAQLIFQDLDAYISDNYRGTDRLPDGSSKPDHRACFEVYVLCLRAGKAAGTPRLYLASEIGSVVADMRHDGILLTRSQDAEMSWLTAFPYLAMGRDPWILECAYRCLVRAARLRPDVPEYAGSLQEFEDNELQDLADQAVVTRYPADEAASVPGFDICPICHTNDEPVKVLVTGCKHAFHESCLLLWISSPQTQCPMCRQQLFPQGKVPTIARFSRKVGIGGIERVNIDFFAEDEEDGNSGDKHIAGDSVGENGDDTR
ncbi:hypothetical protein CAC42_6697 [Sphaceloma murrayae]|uniref:RING-type domain-containing protein n=1 Tax=Sphaceloma murrayae TaxID=2082308 RepID=A0A2K1QG74_9PEZI|nr:hypothetical protein CAC42_6697 [Sphaceloma murrayae]